jgi:hypothetical protein
MPAKDFFVPTLSVNEYYLGCHRGFWGTITDIGFEENNIWFNSGRPDNISFCLDGNYFNDFKARYPITEWEDLVGAFILVFGTAKRAQSGKLYCAIDHIEFMTLK